MTEKRCIACAYESRVLSRAVRANERAARNGKPIDLTVIHAAKQRMAECAARGHHDSAAVNRRHAARRAPA